MTEKKSAKEIEDQWIYFLKEDHSKLTKFLKGHSNLPGTRANLTLAFKLGELFKNSWENSQDFLTKCIDYWAHSGEEYLLLCRNIVLGYILSKYDNNVFAEILYQQNFHPMWRAREAVTLGLQETLRTRPDFTLDLLKKWNRSHEPIVLRNTLMILAEPKVLHENLKIDHILRSYINKAVNIIRKSNKSQSDLKLLKKSLGFVPSVAAISNDEIISDLFEWAESGEKTLKSIVKSNAKKKRLIKHYPEESKKLLELVS